MPHFSLELSAESVGYRVGGGVKVVTAGATTL